MMDFFYYKSTDSKIQFDYLNQDFYENFIE